MFSYKSTHSRLSRSICHLSLIVFSGLALSSCDLAANYTKTDRASNMEFQDFRDGMAERLPEVEANESASLDTIPELQPYVSLTPSEMTSMPLVSVSVNQSVPLRDVLYELAQQAEYDLELDPNIRGAIIFTARNKPLDVVIDRIANVAGLRYKFEEGFLRVELDKPYMETYKVDYLSFIRSNSGTVSTTVAVVSGEGADTGSSYSSTSDSTSDFWAELDLNLTQLLGGDSTGALKTKRDPRISAVEQNPDVAAVSPQGGADGEMSVQPPEAVLRVESLPIDDADTSGDGENASGATYSINKQGGLVNVYASEKTHLEVKEYLEALRKSVTSQVLVEAKVFEISLFDEYINGVNWQVINDELVGGLLTDPSAALMSAVSLGGSTNVGLITNTATVASNTSFVTGVVGNDFQALINAVSGFGTVRALASPRLTVINNQSAVLNVATNRVFFNLDVDRETNTEGGVTTTTIEVDSEIMTVPEGVLINVQPSINLDERTVSMFIRPTVTRVVGVVNDPAVQVVASDLNIVSEIPEVNVQEIDTVIKVDSGQPIVMGGILQDRIVNEQEGVPVLGEIPFFGSMFKNNAGSIHKTELVIFLKATIIETAGQTIHNTDKDLYKTFSGDRRPFKL